MSERVTVKREFYIEVSIESGAIVLRPSNSVYLLVPKDVREKLRRYGVDLLNRKSDYVVECSLATSTGGDYAVSLVYTFRRSSVKPRVSA